MSWKQDKQWADGFMCETKQILGLYLIGEPAQEEDCLRNTDLTVLRIEAVRIGVRIRTNQYLERYGSEFTIRSGRPNGTKTELTKIFEGWGNYFFYGFADDGELRLARWTLADLNAFRIGFHRLYAKLGRTPGDGQTNRDGSSDFHSFRWSDFPDIVVASSEKTIVKEKPYRPPISASEATQVALPFLREDA